MQRSTHCLHGRLRGVRNRFRWFWHLSSVRGPLCRRSDLFYEGICGDPLSSITTEYISGCLYYLVPPECPSDVTTSDDDYTTESSDAYSTDDDYTTESSDDYSTDDDYTIESSDDYSTSDDSNTSPVPSPSTDDDPITPPTTTEGNGGRVRACGTVGALAVAVINVVFLLNEMR
ncbi:unnamed protein product [Ectocarpus sp. 12 AP-2014]